MRRIGVLLHVYEVGDAGWEHIAWGDPRSGQLGSLPKLCQLLLTESSDAPITRIVIFNGPSKKDGLSEGLYTKEFLLKKLPRLGEFAILRPLLEQDGHWQQKLQERFERIVVGRRLARTSDELAAAPAELPYPQIAQVIQIACASHAPRCLQQQATARSQGLLPDGQIWSVVASDMFYLDSAPEDTVIFEKPHLGYDPMVNVSPVAPEVLRHYFSLTPEAKRKFLQDCKVFMDKQREQDSVLSRASA
jgi:hypothetical protein